MLEDNTHSSARVTYLKQGEIRRGKFQASSDAVMLEVFIRVLQNPHSILLNNLFWFTDCNFCHVAVMNSWILCNHLLCFFIPSNKLYQGTELNYKFHLDRSLYMTSLIRVSALQWPISASSAEVKSDMRLLNSYLMLRRTFGGKMNGCRVGFAFLVNSV